VAHIFAYFKKFGFSQLIFIKVPNIKFCLNPSSGTRAITCGQTDGYEEASTPFCRPCEHKY